MMFTQVLIDLFIVFCFSMLMHELGHYIALIGYGVSRHILEIRIMPFKPFIGVGYEGNYSLLSNEKYITVLLAGIATGLLGVWAAVSSLKYPNTSYAIFVAQYLFFCKSDFQNIWRTLK